VKNAKRVGTGDADPLLNGTVAELPSDSTPAIATQAIAGNARRATPLARAIIADRERRARGLAETFITDGKVGSSADTTVPPAPLLATARDGPLAWASCSAVRRSRNISLGRDGLLARERQVRVRRGGHLGHRRYPRRPVNDGLFPGTPQTWRYVEFLDPNSTEQEPKS
jgi:hypothetical protein